MLIGLVDLHPVVRMVEGRHIALSARACERLSPAPGFRRHLACAKAGDKMAAAHILTYARTLTGGGVERAMLRLAAGWLAAGRRVTLVIGTTEGPLAAEIPHDAELVELGNTRYRALFALPAIVRDRQPDLLFCPGNYYTGVAAWTRLRLGRAAPPIVAKMSNAPERDDHGAAFAAANRAWLAQHRRFLDHLVAMTPATATAAAAALHMAGRTSVIPNPPARAIPGAPPPPLPAGRVILGVGRLAPQKRWDRLIAALPALPPDVALVILGEGPLRASLEAQVATLGLQSRVSLPGHAADPIGAMARATMVALTSDYEGVPGVLREALSVGTPVVTTRSSAAVDEIVTDSSLGSIVARDDPAALATALARRLDLPRPSPVAPPGADSAARYLDLFDRLV
jgi:glycosyltransferase involved in cell wall biosynthesis